MTWSYQKFSSSIYAARGRMTRETIRSTSLVALDVQSATAQTFFILRHAEELEGARLAFVQGGHSGSRLVLLTPPITLKKWASTCEARWMSPEMPFKYSEAPIVAYNHGHGDFPLVERFAQHRASYGRRGVVQPISFSRDTTTGKNGRAADRSLRAVSHRSAEFGDCNEILRGAAIHHDERHPSQKDVYLTYPGAICRNCRLDERFAR